MSAIAPAQANRYMKRIPEPARDIDVILKTNVLVVGSGPGGLAAALAAARAGADTALLDRHGCFGGNITQVGVEGFAWYRHEKTVDCEGIGIEFEQRADAMGAAMPEPQSLSQALDAEMFKYVADDLVEESGVTPLLHRLCVAPIVENGVIRGIISESKAGREAILAKRVIDATGDADVAAGAGAHNAQRRHDGRIGHVLDERRQQAALHGTDQSRPANLQRLDRQRRMGYHNHRQGRRVVFALFAQAFQTSGGKRPDSRKLEYDRGHMGHGQRSVDLTYLNLVHLPGIDGTDPNDLTRGEMEGRGQAIYAIAALQRFMPGCEGAKLRNFGM
jgi:ribulose 1,5-bisphosphate synthetase/thiazole synthase